MKNDPTNDQPLVSKRLSKKCGVIFPLFQCCADVQTQALVNVGHPMCFSELPGLKVLSLAKHNFSVLCGVHYCDISKGKSSLSYENITVKSEWDVSWFCIWLEFFSLF